MGTVVPPYDLAYAWQLVVRVRGVDFRVSLGPVSGASPPMVVMARPNVGRVDVALVASWRQILEVVRDVLVAQGARDVVWYRYDEHGKGPAAASPFDP